MIKHLIVGLILIAGLVDHAPTTSPESTFHTASAQFETSSPGVVTRVGIRIQRKSGTARIGLSVHQDKESCARTVCQEVAMISGYTWQEVPRTDALIDRFLASASVHVVVLIHDHVANTDLPVRVDAIWTATGPELCGALLDTRGCLRSAAVTGSVAIGPRRLIPGQTVQDGWIKVQDGWNMGHPPTTRRDRATRHSERSPPGDSRHA